MATPYRVPILDSFEWQVAVLSKAYSSPPGIPAKGNRYIVNPTGSGDWTGEDNAIAYYNGTAWVFVTPSDGYMAWVLDEGSFYYFAGGTWFLFSSASSTLDERFVEVMG